jgi:hypothetical protein
MPHISPQLRVLQQDGLVLQLRDDSGSRRVTLSYDEVNLLADQCVAFLSRHEEAAAALPPPLAPGTFVRIHHGSSLRSERLRRWRNNSQSLVVLAESIDDEVDDVIVLVGPSNDQQPREWIGRRHLVVLDNNMPEPAPEFEPGFVAGDYVRIREDVEPTTGTVRQWRRERTLLRVIGGTGDVTHVHCVGDGGGPAVSDLVVQTDALEVAVPRVQERVRISIGTGDRQLDQWYNERRVLVVSQSDSDRWLVLRPYGQGAPAAAVQTNCVSFVDDDIDDAMRAVIEGDDNADQ